MLIVDAQVHIWRGHLPANAAHRQVLDFTADDLLKEMDAAGVNAAVIHPPGWDPNANELAEEAAKAHPTRLAILGNFEIDKPESRGLIDGWKSRPGMLGLRWALNQPHQSTWMTDGTIDWVWPEAERAGIPIGLVAGRILPEVGKVAERHPGLKLIIDHLGGVGGSKDEAAFANLPQLLALAKYPNVAVKATGAPGYSSDVYPYRNIHGQLSQIYDAFGPRRMFWGTDITRMPCTWQQCITMFTEELPWLNEPDKELVMGRAFCDWLGWPLEG